MPDHPVSATPAPIFFEVRGPAPQSPLAVRLLEASARDKGAPADPASTVLLVDGQSAGPEVVREVLSKALDRPLLLIGGTQAHREALDVAIRFRDPSDALLIFPGDPASMVDFSGTPGPVIEVFEPVPGEEGRAVLRRRTVQSGELPPPEPEPPRDVPDRFHDPNAAVGAVAASVRRAIERFRRGTASPKRTAESDCPEDVLVHRFGSLTKVISISLDDPYYKNNYAPNQDGELSATYLFTGYANLDANGDFQSYVLVLEISADASPAKGQDLLTSVEKLAASRYLGWFQSKVIVGADYKIDDEIRLLGATPSTINKKVDQTNTVTRGFSIDIGFKGSVDVGLNFKNEVSTSTKFEDWMVGELTGPVARDPSEHDRSPTDEGVKWQYAVAFPFNGVIPDDLSAKASFGRRPSTDSFSAPNTSSGFRFVAAAALEVPADSRVATSKKAFFAADLAWELKYYYAGGTPTVFHFGRNLQEDRYMMLDLSKIPLKKKEA